MSFRLGIRNIHVENHDNSTKRKAVIVIVTDEMPNARAKTETSLHPVSDTDMHFTRWPHVLGGTVSGPLYQ